MPSLPLGKKSGGGVPVRQSQGSLAQGLPSARRGTRDAAGAQSDANGALASARRGTKDAPSGIPLPSAQRGTKDPAAQPMFTPRQSTDLGSKAGGRWM